ncbi:MAG TPA: tubulin-like doman-containing protein [Ktedonobacteraceae bacterium]|jgi:hypothetical protein
MAGIDNSSLLESERPRVVTEPRILTPALVVLLGSTPSLAGLELMRHMLGLQPGDMRRVALVYIDTDDSPNALAEFQKQNKGLFQEFQLRIAVPAGVAKAPRMQQTILTRERPDDPEDETNPVVNKEDLTEQHTFIQEKIPQYFANGAGGIRNNGHVAASFNYHSIYNTLDAALSRITRLAGLDGDVRIREVQANLVAFLGGGTGSGILADITVMMRELLANRQYKQRINLFCMLPEPIRGVNESDLKWRKSNATASMLELIAYGQAAGGDPRGHYEKYMRKNVHRLSNDPIANEVYLVGHAAMEDAVDTARIIGIDLFQRITDASGVGELEHSKWVDRRTLGGVDDLGLPTMFSTSCPLEVLFPAEETAAAFAQISAARLLPLIASYKPRLPTVSETDRRNWQRKWRNISRIEANATDPQVIKLNEFRKSDFERANLAKLDVLWSRLERQQRTIEPRIKEIIDERYAEEMRLISTTPNQAGDASLLHDRIQYLQRLQMEYEVALEDLKEKDVPKVAGRPVQAETRLTRPSMTDRVIRANHAGSVCLAYNDTLHKYALATRYRLLETLLKNLIRATGEALSFAYSWARSAEIDEQARKLEEAGRGSMAWRGRLDHPHPHQRHIFDLPTLRTQDRLHNVAVERLYRWATGGDEALQTNDPLDYSVFLDDCIQYIMFSASAGNQPLRFGESIQEINAKRLPERVTSFFRKYYLEIRFEDTNLFELLDKAAPRTQRGQTRGQQITSYLLEHLQRIRDLMSGLIAFEAELWHEGLSSLDTSVYLGMHWRDGGQKQLLDDASNTLGALTERGQEASMNAGIDPHRLQISYGQHAISLSTVRDFYLDRNSAMEAYREHQSAWEKTGGRGSMPVHSSGQAEFLVCDPFALAQSPDAPGRGKPLADRIIRGVSVTPAAGGTTGRTTSHYTNSIAQDEMLH